MPERFAKTGAVGLALFAAGFSGCSEELGPEVFETARVAGTVRLSGQPLASGWIEFLPIEGTRGDLRTTPIHRDGTFATDGVPVGRVAIRLPAAYGPPVPTSLGAVPIGTFRTFQSPIRATIPPKGMSRLDLELAVEAEKYRREQEALRRRMNEPGG
jgi:hypothetical protein